MASLYEETKNYYKGQDTLIRLIIVNIGAMVGLALLSVVFMLMKFDSFFLGPGDQAPGMFKLEYWLCVNSDLLQMLYRPWTLVTYMFLHGSFWHIFFNMLWLFFMGRVFTEILGSRRLLTTYLLGGIVGAVLFIISYNIFPLLREAGHAPMLGASASVMAIIVGLATYSPNYAINFIFIGPVKLKYIALFFVLSDVLSLSGNIYDNTGGHLGHLGGAIYGFYAMYNLKKGKETGRGFERFMRAVVNTFKPKPKMRVAYKKHARPVTDEDYNQAKKDQQREIDAILDKISKSGYESLSKREKDILFKFGKDK